MSIYCTDIVTMQLEKQSVSYQSCNRTLLAIRNLKHVEERVEKNVRRIGITCFILTSSWSELRESRNHRLLMSSSTLFSFLSPSCLFFLG